MIDRQLMQQFEQDGYLVLPAIEEQYLAPLRAASAQECHRADVHPEFGGGRYRLELRPGPFADVLAAQPLFGVLSALLGTPDWRFASMFVLLGDYRKDCSMRWHRDGMEPHENHQEEMAILERRRKTIQWNAPLYDGDRCFRLLPGSHRRSLRQDEIDHLKEDPRATLPGEKTIELQAGEGLFYDFSIFHRGIYTKDEKRETLHCCCEAMDSRWQSYSSGLHKDYMLEDGYLEEMPQQLQPVLANTIAFVKGIDAVQKGAEMSSLAYSEMLTKDESSE